MRGLAIPSIYNNRSDIMASFTNRGTKKKPSWQYTISAKPKPIRKGGFRKKEEAEIEAAYIENRMRKGMAFHLKPEPFNDYFLSWLEIYKTNLNKNSYQRYLDTHKTIDEYFGDTPIQDITIRSYQLFLNEYGKTHAKVTSDKMHIQIRSCVRKAMSEGVIHRDFTIDARKTGTASKRKEEKHLDFEESDTLYDYLMDNLDRSLNYYLLLLGLVTGLRFAELVGLQRSDFIFFNNTLNIDKTWGYTNKMHEGFGPTKNDQSVRQIKVDENVMEEFKKLFKKTPENINKLVFYSPKSKYKVIANASSNKLLKAILTKLEIKTDITMHGLRHTHASVLLYQKASVNYVSERLGHGDIMTTYNTYSHILKEGREEDDKIAINLYV